MTAAQTVAVLLDEELLTLTRIAGMLRRRNLPISSFAVGPTGTPGCSRLIIMLQTDADAADRVARQLRNVIGVREAAAFAARDGVARELVLVKVRASQDHYGDLLDVALLYKAAIIDETADATILEVSGSEAFVLSFLRALDRFEVLDIARSGVVALGRSALGAAAVSLSPETVP
ncbi:MAG TPA: acetolactate synthase small subunit [Gemmatimonadales bacterium]|jgi:acetolactate synthase-1/3 small subunit|nr:acetolactate synthase small subunit [Gemmatimonadales bacterium]